MHTHLIWLIGYSIAQLALGAWISRRVKTSSDFFVAGRALGPGLLFSTMLAANIGAGSTVGATGLGYRDGFSAIWWVLSAGIGSLLLAFWIGPAIRRVAAEHDLRTVGDYLELRYGVTVRTLISGLLWVGSVFILAGQLIAVSWILNVIAGVPKTLGCILAGVLITVYFASGGLLTSAYVNVVQLIVKLVGFAIAIPFALSASGGWDALRAFTPTETYWNPWQGGESGLVYLAMLGPAFVVSPGLLQKVYGARDDRTVRIGVGFNALALILYAAVPVLLGMMARVQFPDLPQSELALPTLLVQGVPAAVGALGLAAVFSAELSAADAVLFILTTSLSQDFYKRFRNPGASDAQLLRVTRFTAVIAGAAGVGIALVAAGVVSALSIFYTIMGVSLFVPILAGLYSTRTRSADALAAIIAGIAVVGGWRLLLDGKPINGITAPMGGLIAAIVAFLVVHLVGRARGGDINSGGRPPHTERN
ncbi:putative sodium/solute symporter [Gemmatimonas aurantiaca T-27]|nr:sodium:solute symporter family protein [Gemmatimonas aurantiaca]BAH40592.1 putative sodium/solute symporter [Gemmatimonas aurantiaca T-27]